MNPVPTAFAWLTHEEFKQLSTDAKVIYLAEAIDAGRPAQAEPTLQ